MPRVNEIINHYTVDGFWKKKENQFWKSGMYSKKAQNKIENALHVT